MKDLSVVIAAYNAEDTLGVQLEALVGQGPDLDWEVVVVDNRSTDGTVAVAESFADRLDLRVVSAPDRPSGAYARNVAVATCDTPWILFVDADDMVAPGWLEAMAGAMREHRFVAGRLDAEVLNSPSAISRTVPQGDGLQWWPVGPPLPHAGGGNMGIERSVYEAVGGFEPDLIGLQDVDFCWRVQLAGVPLHFVPEATLHVGLRSTLRSMWRQGRNYGAAQAEIEHRFAHVRPEDVPEAARATPPEAARQKSGKVAVLIGMVRSVPHPGALIWQVGWYVGHKLGEPGRRARARTARPRPVTIGGASS